MFEWEQHEWEAWPEECAACYSLNRKADEIRKSGQKTYGASLRLYRAETNGN